MGQGYGGRVRVGVYKFTSFGIILCSVQIGR